MYRKPSSKNIHSQVSSVNYIQELIIIHLLNQLTSSCQHHTIKVVTIVWKEKAELKCLWKEQLHIQLVHVHFVIKEERRLILVLNGGMGSRWRKGCQQAIYCIHVTASSWRGVKGGEGGPKHVSRTLKSKNNASRWLKFRAHISRLFSKIHFVFIVVVYRVCFLLCSLLRTFLTEFYFKYRGS